MVTSPSPVVTWPSIVVTSLSLVVTWLSPVVTSPSLVVTWLSSLVTSLSFVVTFLSSLVTFPSRLVTRGQRARKSSRKKCNRQAVHRKKTVCYFFVLFFQPVTALLGWSLKKVVNKLLIMDDVVPFLFIDHNILWFSSLVTGGSLATNSSLSG